MSALVNHVAIVSESRAITLDDVSTVAAAVAKQVQRDFGPAWGIQATVQAFASLEAIPGDYWQVLLVDHDDVPGAAGYHTDGHGQPLAVVEVAGTWPITVSHEVLEMLADGAGNRIVSAEVPPQATIPNIEAVTGELSRVDYLVEVCDPIEDDSFSYEINGVPVSDFVLPNFYTSVETVKPADFLGLLATREVAEGGYISFRDPATGKWWQLFMDDGVVTVNAAAAPSTAAAASLREKMDYSARAYRAKNPKSLVDRWLRVPSPGSISAASNTRAFLRYLSGTLGK